MYLFSDRTLKKIILKGRGFRCGSDVKMMRMWFGLEIDVVGLPPLCEPCNYSFEFPLIHFKILTLQIKLYRLYIFCNLFYICKCFIPHPCLRLSLKEIYTLIFTGEMLNLLQSVLLKKPLNLPKIGKLP